MLWTLGLFSLFFSWNSAFSQEKVIIDKIIVKGNTISSDRVIFKNIRTREGNELVDHILNEDVKRLYELGRFKNIYFDTKRSTKKNRIDLIIFVKEKPLIRKRIFTGFKKIKPTTYEEDIRTVAGDRFDISTVKADIVHIEQTYRENGYLFTKVKYLEKPVANQKDVIDIQFIINENAQVKIADILFVGNEHVHAGRLKRIMETKVDRFYNKGVYEPDTYIGDLDRLRAYYHSLGYLDAKVEYGKSYFSENKKWLYLNVNVNEGPLYIVSEIIIKGADVAKPKDILEDSPLRIGMPFSDMARVQLMDHIEKFYGEMGRIFTRVVVQSVTDEKRPKVNLTVKIQEGEEVFLEKIKIFGNSKTKDVVIRRELDFYPKEKINSQLIRDSERHLHNLGFFEKVSIVPIPTEEPNKANIEIQVEEKNTGSINFAIGFSSIESIFASVRYTQRNFDWGDRSKGIKGLFNGKGYIGDGQLLQLAINTGTRSRRYTIDFNEPWVYNRKIRFGYGLFRTESEISDDFDESRQGGYVRIGKEFKKDLEGFLTYSLSQIKISDISPFVSPAIREQEGQNTVSSLENFWLYDSRDSRFFPTYGWYVKPSVTLAGGALGGTQDFIKTDLDIRTYKSVFKFGRKSHHVLSGRLHAGYVTEYGDSDRVPIFERFFAGGLGSVRGFENRSLGPREGDFEIGGNFLTVFNVEYTFPISEQDFRGVFFYDQGNVYEDVDAFSYGEMRSALGFGLRLHIPMLGPFPISLDFAKAIRKKDGDDTETFSFNFGNFF